MIPEVIRNANFAVVDKYFKNFQIVFADKNEEDKVNKIVFNKDRLGNYLITIGKVDRQNAFSEERNEVVGVGFAPTIRTLRTGVSSTGLRASPTTENSIAQESETVNDKEARADEIPGKENKRMETKTNEEPNNLITPKEYLKNLLSKAEIEVVEDTGIMRTILDEGKRVQKMAAKYGTSQDIDGEENFNGFGTYVVSVNEDNARRLGIKIASKRYGGSFYINGEPFNDFLKERDFSPYWTSRLEQFKDYNVEYLADDFLRADVKGNPALEKERDTLSTLFSLGLVEYKREQAFLYSVDIPDNDGTNYLLYGNPIGIENANRINERLERMSVEWRVTRNDIGKNVYFNTLSEKVFGGSQESASKFLKEAGYVGMEMNSANYIVFDDKDMKVTNRVQYMIDGDSNVYGFAYDGKIYADPEIATSNTYAHEYTHLWDAYTQRTNPELWEKGKDIFKGTSLWNEVMIDENYQNLSNDDEILSECHSRIIGKMAEKVLGRIAERNGGILRDQVIDWDNEVAEYVAGELGAEFPEPELGSENYVSDSVRLEIAREFLSQPMKDLMEGRKIGIEREKSELYKENEAELKFIVEEMMEETLPGLPKMAKPVENEKDPAASTSTQLSGATSAQSLLDAQDTATAISTHIRHKDNIVEIKNQEHYIEMFNAFAGEIANSDAPMSPKEFLDKIKKTFEMNVAAETTGYVFTKENDETFKIRISDHKAVLRNRLGARTELTSLVIQLNDSRRRDSDKAKLSEFVYFPESLDKETQVGIINGINDWILRHEYTDKHYDQMYVSTARALQERLKESEQTIQKMAEEHAFPDVGEYFKFNKNDSENFVKALDNFDGLNPLQLIKVGNIPPVMKALGISDNPIEMPQSVVSKALREEATYPNDKKGHALTMEHVKRIPESLADPIMVFKSRTRDDSYVFFTEQKDEAGRSIIIPVAVDKRYGRLVINEITSMYGKDNEANFVKTNIEQGNLVYADKKRSLDWERECQVQFLAQVLPSEGSYSSILTKENLVNFVSAVGNEKIQKMARPVENEISEQTAKEWAKEIEAKVNSGMEQSISEILAESEAAGVRENAKEIASEICASILSVYKEIAEHGDTGYFEGGERQMSDKFAAGGVQKVLEAHGIFLPAYPDESGEREKVFSTIMQVSDEISEFIKTNAYENFHGGRSLDSELERQETANGENPFLNADPEQIQELYEQAEAVEKMQQEAAATVEFDGNGNPYYPKNEAAEEIMPEASTGKDAASAMVEPSAENEENAQKEKQVEIKGMDGKTSEIKIEFGKTTIAKFAMVTQNGLKSYSDLTVASYEKTTDSYLLVSGDKSQQVRVQSSTMATLLSDERQREIEKINSQIEENQKTGRSTESLEFKKELLEQGMSVAQYNDFFQTRENCANNFRHNLSVLCRKEANSPLDALKVANKIITQMSDAEKLKTRDLLDLLRKDGQSRNEVLVDVYNEAVKATPLNEQYLLNQRYDKMIARPMYDTVSGRGEKIDGNFNLRIGDTLKMTFNVDKDIAFGGTKLERKRPAFGNKEVMFSECKIISSSKEGNVVTLMDGNKSFYDVPRDTFLKEYAKREKYEKKQEIKEAHKKNIMRLDIER